MSRPSKMSGSSGAKRPPNGALQNRPPMIKSNIELRHTYRFVSTSGGRVSITPTSLLCAAGTICITTNSLVTSLYNSVRVNRVSIWSPPASQGATATCSVDWVGSANSPSREFSDTTVSVSTPAHVSCSPPPMSLASFWQIPSASALFQVIAPTGSIIDVSMSLILQDDDATQAQSAVVTGVLGLSYYLSLDPTATHQFTPVSLPSTT
jgi:hypothetical protein